VSYILEALKRAERERRAGTGSLLDETPGAGTAAAAPAWQRWIMPAAIFALAAAIVAYLIFGGHRERAQSAPVAVATSPVPVAAAPVSKPVQASNAAAPAPLPRIKPEPLPETTAPAIEDDGRISSLKDLDDKPAPPAPAAAAALINDESEAADPSATARASTTREKPPARRAADDDAESPANSADDAQPSSASSPSNTEAARSGAAPATAASTQNLREMPDDFRAGFPAITVDVHAYSDDPAQRFVLVGGKRYHEGDTLPQGPRIFGIVPEGIVFDWQGQRVLYAMNR